MRRQCQCGGTIKTHSLSNNQEAWSCKSCGRYEAMVTGQINCESEANARLIAAAPELFAACNLFVEYEQTTEDDGMAMMFAYNAVKVAVYAAIAKAVQS